MGLIGLIRLIGQPLWYALPVRERDNQPIITTLRLPGFSPATGGGNVPLRGVAPSRWSGLIDLHKPRKRRSLPTTTRLPGETARRQAQTPAGIFQGRYRAVLRINGIAANKSNIDLSPATEY